MFRKIFLMFTLIFAVCSPTASAETTAKPRVAVVDFATLNGAVTGNLNADKVGLMCVDYIIEALVDSEEFFVMSK